MTLSELSPKQKTVLKWAFTPSTREKYKAIICDGAVRSGKTVCMLTGFILWAMRYFNGQNFGVCGKTVASAERNIIRPAQEQADLAACFSLSYRRSDHVLMVRGLGRENRFYIFGGKDESSYALIQGITLCGVLFDEVALMPRSFVEQAIARRLGAGTLVFSSSCVHTLEEFQAYVWDEKAGERGEDKPVKANDHAMDAMRYFVSTILGRQVVSVKRRPRGM